MEKFLFFNTGANDSLCMPARRLTDMGMESNGTSLILHFIAPFGGNDGVGEITVDVTITDNKGRLVMEAIAEEILQSFSLYLAYRVFKSSTQPAFVSPYLILARQMTHWLTSLWTQEQQRLTSRTWLRLSTLQSNRLSTLLMQVMRLLFRPM